ncbi:leucine-rich repeat domain-containing protein [Desulfogranum marinum]|uniref:leucine-rich repeat domain-containing protein n=1 Tax=Desulfogranum marinum TaxID=453220 RepID=UPI0019669BBA|nr:leucine-rich repeat domain-containing protein [Desulfogranum marinum]MBM9514699.1 leucine-rich repeat domain-containing protein [Desulfogranum marinum]
MFKKIGLSILILLVALVSVSLGVEVTCFEESFTRGDGQPVTEYRTFPGVEGQALLRIYNGTEDGSVEKVSSSTISVNGIDVATPDNFNQNVDYVEIEVELVEGDNELTVQLRAKPGGAINVKIVQEVDAEAAGYIGPEGGMIEVEDLSSSLFGIKLLVQKEAITEMVLFSLGEKKSTNDNLPSLNNSILTFELRPGIEKFNKPVVLAIPYNDSDNDGYIDGTEISESDINVFITDQHSTNWNYLYKSDHDYEKNIITVMCDHFSDIALAENINLSDLMSEPCGVPKNLDALFAEGVDISCSNMLDMSLYYYIHRPYLQNEIDLRTARIEKALTNNEVQRLTINSLMVAASMHSFLGSQTVNSQLISLIDLQLETNFYLLDLFQEDNVLKDISDVWVEIAIATIMSAATSSPAPIIGEISSTFTTTLIDAFTFGETVYLKRQLVELAIARDYLLLYFSHGKDLSSMALSLGLYGDYSIYDLIDKVGDYLTFDYFNFLNYDFTFDDYNKYKIEDLVNNGIGYVERLRSYYDTDGDGYHNIIDQDNPPTEPSAPMLISPYNNATLDTTIANSFSWEDELNDDSTEYCIVIFSYPYDENETYDTCDRNRDEYNLFPKHTSIVVGENELTPGKYFTWAIYAVNDVGASSSDWWYFTTLEETSTCTDSDYDDFYLEAGCGTEIDCNDEDPEMSPGLDEVCNDGKDNDCDGQIDEGCSNIEVFFPDQNLETLIRENVNNLTDPITLKDLDRLPEYLSGRNRGITDLSGIEYCTNIRTLNLPQNNISDLTPISELKNLFIINFSENKIVDINAISELTNLGSINFSENQISDIKSIENLINLQSIDVSKNKIYKIPLLNNFNSLSYLNIEENLIEDITPISNLNKLYTLHMSKNDISDINAVENLTNLQKLSADGNNINDLQSLSDLVKLQFLSLSDNVVSDLSSLSHLTDIQSLSLNYNNISDITPISSLHNILSLSLHSNTISDTSALSGLTSLVSLYIGANNIYDISSISKLTDLKSLGIDNNHIDDISSLYSIVSIEYLTLSSNEITDIEILERLVNLKILTLDNNKIEDISPLVYNTGLDSEDYIYLRYNPLNYDSQNTYIPQLIDRNVNVIY